MPRGKISGKLEVDIKLLDEQWRESRGPHKTDGSNKTLDVALVELFVGCAHLRPVCQATDLFKVQLSGCCLV